jgi:hypothetical protein
MHFSDRHFARRRRRRSVDPTAHIGANPNELLEDASDVSLRNWGLETPGVDPADSMFAATPPPVVVCFTILKLFISLSYPFTLVLLISGLKIFFKNFNKID